MQDTITIRGNLAADPEQRRISTGDIVTSFRVGTTARRRDKATGEWTDDETNWYQVSAFRTLGEHVFASLRKGHPVIVSGRFRLRTWESSAGKGMSADIEADAVGHDLRWGSTVYTRAPRDDAGADQPSGDAWAADGSAGSDWPTALPGAATSIDDQPASASEQQAIHAPV
ncbi:single-stranded DNA-binding protein [Microbacterium sp. NPDC076911]|uniref:single-stranded DNA-binding protein n=1 Tax=Microbacterium sp. NPDC076911 TaxID=3154958 RepID=UPI003441B46D